jgi:hypothetical protein
LVDDDQASRPAEKHSIFAVSASFFGNVLASLDQIRVLPQSRGADSCGAKFLAPAGEKTGVLGGWGRKWELAKIPTCPLSRAAKIPETTTIIL